MQTSFFSISSTSSCSLSPSQSTCIRSSRSCVGESSLVYRDLSFLLRKNPQKELRCSRSLETCTHKQKNSMLLFRTEGFHGGSERRGLAPTTCRSSSGGSALVAEEEEGLDAGKGSGVSGEDVDALEFVEVGIIAETHGVHGEVRVRSLTDFPEERFEKPGVRWVRRVVMGKTSMQRVELVKGREGPGKQPSWLVTLEGFATPEEASHLLGGTMLVSAKERPPLQDDGEEFYIPDLVGMSVSSRNPGKR